MSKLKIIGLHFQGRTQTIAAFLIETSEGPVLVETGPHSTLPQLEKGLAQNNYTSKDIKHVFLSHIHLDHAGAAWYFANLGAKIYVHPKGYKHLASPEKLMNSARMIYQDQMDRLWGEMHPIAENQLYAVEDQEVFTIGDTALQAHYTPGHAVHHIAWQWEDQLFAGDVAGVRINTGPVVPPCPPPDIHIEDWLQSIQHIRQLGLQKIYLTHFGAVEHIDAHLKQLEQVLSAWATWMKPHFDAGTAAAELTKPFQEYVAVGLEKAGVDQQGIQQYEIANPAWMSVAGLLRYWKIKYRTEN